MEIQWNMWDLRLNDVKNIRVGLEGWKIGLSLIFANMAENLQLWRWKIWKLGLMMWFLC
jgi:hypothetical protein